MKIVCFSLLLCIQYAVHCYPTEYKPFWMRRADPHSLDRVAGIRAGASKGINGWGTGELTPENNGYMSYGEVGAGAKTRLNAGASLIGNDLDAEVGLAKNARVYGGGGYGEDNQGSYLLGEAGGNARATMFGGGALRRGDTGLAADGELTAGLEGRAGSELRHDHDGRISGKANARAGADTGFNFDINSLGRK